MRTGFSAAQLTDPHLKAAEETLRACVHCGFCTATCPTYVILGDERDSPRGRIALIQTMLELGTAPGAETVLHLDRCLSCLGCRTTCPSGVDYSVLIDTARAHVARTYRRPWHERAFRSFVLAVLTKPALFAAVLNAARTLAPIARVLPGRLAALARGVPRAWRISRVQAARLPAPGAPERTIALLPGCVQRVLAPEIDAAAARVLVRQGAAVRPLPRSGCCGALAFHMGEVATAKTQARAVMAAAGDAGAVSMTATGCVAFLKEYPRLFLSDPEAETARRFAARVADFCELAGPPAAPVLRAPTVAYHPPCSLQHGQRLTGRVEALLTAAGFELVPFADPHLCCGSAGSYSLLQPALAESLRARKLAALAASGARLTVTGNIGCLVQLSGADAPPAVHLAELLDWADGGPPPEALRGLPAARGVG